MDVVEYRFKANSRFDISADFGVDSCLRLGKKCMISCHDYSPKVASHIAIVALEYSILNVLGCTKFLHKQCAA